jgi:hypothetical protein
MSQGSSNSSIPSTTCTERIAQERDVGLYEFLPCCSAPAYGLLTDCRGQFVFVAAA